MTSSLRLGIIGLSPGNGHPYSWSAIFNGYDPVAMEGCGFPVIPRYLEKQEFPRDAIPDAVVTHVWTQDIEVSKHISAAAHIQNIVKNPEDMIGYVDGILLARDDAGNHLHMAAPFLNAGVPIYIDKPLALTAREAEYLYSLEKYVGQIFTCSALRYARELQLSELDLASLGKVEYIQGFIPNDWNRYAIHLIEPMLILAGDYLAIESTSVIRSSEVVSLSAKLQNDIIINVNTLGAGKYPLVIKVIGDAGSRDLQFLDTYSAFKSALEDFVIGIRQKDVRIPKKITIDAIKLIEAGNDEG